MDILTYSVETLMRNWNKTKEEVLTILMQEAEKISCQIECRASELHSIAKPRIITPIESFNKITNGGLEIGTITEIVGPPGSGKTQFCISLVAGVLKNDCHSKILYIDTNKNFSFNRLYQNWNQDTRKCFDEKTRNMLSRLFFIGPESKEEFVNIFYILESHLNKLKPNILIIDCMAYYPRTISNMSERTQITTKIISILKRLSVLHEVMVLLTNQITGMSGEENIPKSALGTSWAHYVNVRLYLSMTCQENGEFSESSIKRKIIILKSSSLFNFEVPFVINASGLK